MSQYVRDTRISTPENLYTMKNAPGRSSGISKTSLTPCRRLGLSRRFKTTPNNKNQDHLSISSNNSIPVSTTKSSISETSSIVNNEEHEKLRTRNSNSEINIKLVSENVDRRAEENSNIEIENENSTPDMRSKTKSLKINKKKTLTSKAKVKSKQKKFVQELDDLDLFDENVTKINIKDNATNLINFNNTIPLENTVLKEIQTSENEYKVKEAKKATNSKSSFARRLSMKKTNSQEELTDKEEFLSTPKSTSSLIAEQFTKECNVVLEEVNHLDKYVGVRPSRKSKSKKRIIYSSDEDDFVSSQSSNKGNDNNEQQNTEDNCDKRMDEVEDCNEKINQIKSRIKQKEKELTELKQAAIYKKLHDVTELNQLTEVWKNGCQVGLTYLLPKLQEHGDMDMPTLMKNLNIPKKMIYNADPDTFI